MYTIGQVGKLLGVSKSTIRNWIREGKIIANTDQSGVHIFSEETVTTSDSCFLHQNNPVLNR